MTDRATSITNLHLHWGIFITSGRLDSNNPPTPTHTLTNMHK